MRTIKAWVAGCKRPERATATRAVLDWFATCNGEEPVVRLVPDDHNPVDPDAVFVIVALPGFHVDRFVGFVPLQYAKSVRVILADNAMRKITMRPTKPGGLSLVLEYVAPTKKASAALLTRYSEELAGAVDGVDLQAVAQRAYQRRAEMTRADKITLKGLYGLAVKRQRERERT